MSGLYLEGQRRWTHHFLPAIWLWVLAAAHPTVLGFFLGDSKAVLRGCADHWTLQDRAVMPLLFQMTVCVHIRVAVPGAWAAFSYSTAHAPRPELGLEGDEGALYGWLLGVRHRFPLRLSPTHWHRVCLRRDVLGNSFSLEVDGEVVAERTVIAEAISPSGSLWLGCRPRDRPPGAMLGEVELYLFRVWADLGGHAPCEDGSVIGWDSRFWGVTSAKARHRDPSLLCDHRRVRSWARGYRHTGIHTAIAPVYKLHKTPLPELPSTTTASSPVIATFLSHNQSKVPGSQLVNCDIAQLCSDETAYYWMFINVKVKEGQKTEKDVYDWMLNVFSCDNMIELCQGARQLQKVEVSCDAKEDNRRSNCNVLLQLSHAVSACKLQRALKRAGPERLQLMGQVERVGRELCEDVEPSSGRFVRCTSSSPLDDICQSATHANLTCSFIEPGSIPVPQPVRESCGWEGPRLCDCTAFCSDARQFFALSINISSPTVDVNFIKSMLSKLSGAPACDTMSQSSCRQYFAVSKRYQVAQLECHGTEQRLYSCMVILKMSRPVDVCSLANFLQLHMDNSSGITTDKPLTRMVVCGRPGLPPSALLESNLTWVTSHLLSSEICQPNHHLLRCEGYETLAVLLTDSCPDPSEPLPTNPSTQQPSTPPISNITTASETTPPLPANTTQHINTTAEENAATQLKNASQGTAQPSTTTQLTMLKRTQTSPAPRVLLASTTTATPLLMALRFNTTAMPQNNDITFNTTPPNASPGPENTVHTTPLASQMSMPNTTSHDITTESVTRPVPLNTTTASQMSATQHNTTAVPLSTTQPSTTVSPAQPNATLHSTTLAADNGAVNNTTATGNTTLQITTPGSHNTTFSTTMSSYTPTTLGPTVTFSDNTTVHNTNASGIITLSTPTHNAKLLNTSTSQDNTTQFPAIAPINSTFTQLSTTTPPLPVGNIQTLMNTTDALINTTQITTTLSPKYTTVYNAIATNNGTLESSTITTGNATVNTTTTSPNDTTADNITTNVNNQTVLNITLPTTTLSPNNTATENVTTATTRETQQNVTVPNNNTVIFTAATQGNETLFNSTTSQDNSTLDNQTSTVDNTTVDLTTGAPFNTPVNNQTTNYTAMSVPYNVTTATTRNDTSSTMTTPATSLDDTQSNETLFNSTTSRDDSRQHNTTVSSSTPTTLGPTVTVSDNTTAHNRTAFRITTLSTPTHNAKLSNTTTYNTMQFPVIAPINSTLLNTTTPSLPVANLRTLLNTTDALINTTRITTTLSPNYTTAYNVIAATNNGTLESSTITASNATVNTTTTSPNDTTADNITTNVNNQTVLNITLPTTTLSPNNTATENVTIVTTRETQQNTTIPNNNTVIFTAATQGNETLFNSVTSQDNSTVDNRTSTVDNTTVDLTTGAPFNTPVNNQTTSYTAMSVPYNVTTATTRNDTSSTMTTPATSLNATFSPNTTRVTNLNLNSTNFNHVFKLTTKGPGFKSSTAAPANTFLEPSATTSTMMVHGHPPVQANQISTTKVSLTSATTAPLQTTNTIKTTITTTSTPAITTPTTPPPPKTTTTTTPPPPSPTTTPPPPTTTITTTVAKETTISNQEELDEEAEELLDQTQDASQLNSSQVAQVVGKLEKLLDSPTVSQSVGQTAINIISNLMDGDSSALSASANRLIQAVDGLGLKLVVTDESAVLTANSLILAVRTVDGTNFPSTSVNILNTAGLQLNILSRSQSRSSETILGSVFLPSSLTEGLSPEEQRQASRVQFSFYTTTSLFQDIALGNQTFVSPVLGSSVANLSIGNLSQNIQFTIRNTDPVPANYEASCAFWDFALNGGGGGWNPAGCFVLNTTQENTTCSCNHLTSFAILMDVSRGGIPDPQQAVILTYITYIGCGISAIFLAVTLLTYISFPKLLRDIPSKILVQLCLSLLFLNLLFLLDGWLALYPATGLCISTAFFLHYFLLTSFTWAGLEALHMYLSIVQVFTPYLSRYMLRFSLLGWGLPLIVVIIVISVDKDNYGLVTYGKNTDSTSDDFCWLRNDIAFYVGVVAYFILIFALSLLVFIVVLVQLARIKRQNPQNQSPQRGLMTDLRSITGLIILLGLTWGFALFAWGPLYLPFIYLFSIFNSLQGFFIFVFHCAVKENVRRQWRTYLCCGSLRLAENSEWSRTATQNPNKLSVTTATSSALNPASRSSSVISEGINNSGSVFADSGISDGSHGDVVLNEIHRNTAAQDVA